MKRAAASETERIEQWRREQARKLGFEATEVVIIGDEWHIDIDQLAKLITQGCKPMTALRILR